PRPLRRCAKEPPRRWRASLRAMARRAAAAPVRQPPRRGPRMRSRGPFPPTTAERAQEVEDVLLLRGREQVVEPRDHRVRLGAGARVLLDRPEDSAVGRSGATVVQEEDPLACAPEWSATEFLRPRIALRDAIGEARSH